MEICAEDLSRKEKAASAIVLIAFFDQNVQHQKEIKRWLTRYTMQRETDLERIWFTSSDAVEKLEKYAGGFHIAFISLDDGNGQRIGQKIYDLNPDCLICYYRSCPCRLEPLLNSRPYAYFSWADGEQALKTKLDDMIERVVFSSNTFCYETKKALYCYPVKNIQYFQSNLKYVHIKTFLGNDAIVYAKMSEIVQGLTERNLHIQFIQIHKSFVVNRSAIQGLNKQDHTVVLSSGEALPISDTYYQRTVKLIQRNSLGNG